MEGYDLIVIGAGAAGLTAAGTAAQQGARVLLLDKNRTNGRKLLITGKGRCNITNACDIADFIKHIPVNGRFLYSAFHQFTNQDLMALLERYGLKTKEERGQRVFPVSDRAADVLSALEKYVFTGSVRRITGCAASLLQKENTIYGVQLADGKRLYAPCVVVATGGVSYPQTGSTGDGYRLAEQAGHTIVPPRPSLVPLETEERWCAEAMGLALRNIAIRVTDENNKLIYEDFGELMLAHYGVSGPVIISASAHLTGLPKQKYYLSIDLKPALEISALDKRLLRDFEQNINREFQNALDRLFPKMLIPVMVRLSGIDPHKRVHEITRPERLAFAALIKALPLTIKRTRPIAEAIVTSGGVAVGEVNPRTMASKKADGLYFAGEVLDVDGYTGGFNLQIAFSTGYCAGMSAAAFGLGM